MDPVLTRLGWDDSLASLFAAHAPDEGLEPARIIARHRGACVAGTPAGDVWAEPAVRLLRSARGAEDFPATGDWVALRPAQDGGRAAIHAVMPRRTKISRKAAGLRTEEQILAANVDVVLLAVALNLDRVVARLERYLVLGWESGARPVVVLTKPDTHPDPDAVAREVDTVAFGVPVLIVSGRTGEGVSEVAALLRPHRTGVLLGPSGVGKSTLINRLATADVLAVGEVRAKDARGRHTTSVRELVLLPGGGSIIDTPGLREIQLWDGAGVERSFEDVTEIAARCRFRDCAHAAEPGCAVRAAVDAGALDAARLERYRKIERELAALEARKDRRAQAEQRRRWKIVTKEARRRTRPR